MMRADIAAPSCLILIDVVAQVEDKVNVVAEHLLITSEEPLFVVLA